MKATALVAIAMSALLALFQSINVCCASEPANSGPAFYRWAPSPPMGWNSYNNFGSSVTEDEVLANATYMKDKLLAHGWQYVVVDFRWSDATAAQHDTNGNGGPLVADNFGRLLPASNRFPSAADGKGFKPLADKIHAMGLRFGIHIMRGIPRQAVKSNTPIEGSTFSANDAANTGSTCAWCADMFGVKDNPAGQGWYDSIFRLYASWGVDFVKVDDLTAPYYAQEVEMVRKAIDKCGRPIVFSTSPGCTPFQQAAHVSSHANMWRLSGDFWDNWKQLAEAFDLAAQWQGDGGPGHWPDLDMLQLGRLGTRCVGGSRMTHFSHDEQRTHLTLWCIARSPLMFGGDLPRNDAFTDSLLTNDEVLAVNQHSTGNRQLYRRGDTVAWIADVPNSADRYVALFHLGDAAHFDTSKALYRSALVDRQTPGQMVDISADISKAKRLILVVEDGGDGFACDHADWIEPKLTGPHGDVKLTDLPWVSATAGWGQVAKGKSVTGKPLTVGTKTFADGIGTHSTSVIVYDLPAGYTRFTARGGLDRGGVSQKLAGATVRFAVYADAEEEPAKVTMAEAGVVGPCRVRDLWSGRDLGLHAAELGVHLPPHGAALYRLSPVAAVKTK